jgi:Asp-tRNA(Asn)/Glu-tRNA(Gln) amidotransferase A subunit family amidase
MTPDPAFLTASEMLARLRSGALTVERLAAACLARAAAREPVVHAWSWLDPDHVLAQARALDRAPHRGRLHGLPIGVKDVILTEDMPTQYNSPAYRGFHPRIDAACVMTLRAEGALIFGKTDTVEFAARGRKAATGNPHDPARTPGGSSSGSGAAVADFHVPLALGTQTGGSMIRPASYCGVWAIKPTWNLVSNEGAKRYSASLDTIGWYARSAADLGLVYDIFDLETASPPPFAIAGARIALYRSPVWDQAEPATQHALIQAGDLLRAAGATVTDLDLPAPFETLVETQNLIMRAEGRAAFLSEYRAHPDQIDQTLREEVENADGFTRRQLLAAYNQAAECRALFDRIASGYDAILTPSSAGEAPIGLSATGPFAFNAMWTLLHVPTINIPAFTGPNALPVGLTLTAPRFTDRRLLATAEALAPLFPGNPPVAW